MLPILVGRNHTYTSAHGISESEGTLRVLQQQPEGVTGLCLNTSSDRELATAPSTLFRLCAALTGTQFFLSIPEKPNNHQHKPVYIPRLSEGVG